MSKLIKGIGAVVAGAGAITGIIISTKSSPSPTLETATKSNSHSAQEKSNQEAPKDPKEGYYVLASWENGTEWKVKSDKFLEPNEWNVNGIGFDDVTMYLGNKQIEKGHEFTTQRSSKKYVLHKKEGYKYKLEDGKSLIIGGLRSQWDNLGVTKYEETPLTKWTKPSTVADYDIKFDTCKFTKVKHQDEGDQDTKIKVSCQVGQRHQTIWRELTKADWKYSY